MRVDRPGPGEELNPGAEAPARPAASLIVLRDSAGGPEVLLVQRNPAARFMGGAWVFPGGAVDEGDHGPEGTALREAHEEAGLRLPGTAALAPFSRWITPSEVKVRFDTWFFLAAAPPDARVSCDGEECVDHRWIRPADALAAGERGELLLVFPTVKHLEQLAQFRTVAEALASARARDVQPVQPRVVLQGDHATVLLPGEPGYD